MSTIPTLCLLPLLWLRAGGQSSADAGSIAGQVVDSDSGALIAAARVLLYIPTPGPDGVALVPHETVSDEAGTFQYVGVEPGHYQISAIKEDYIRPNGSRQAEFVEVSGDRGPVEVVYHLRRSAVISGRVFDLAGQPASRATVMALHARRTESDFKNATPAVRTDQDGRFRLTGLDDGQYLLKAWLEAEREAGGPTVLISITYYAGALDVEAATSMTIAAG